MLEKKEEEARKREEEEIKKKKNKEIINKLKEENSILKNDKICKICMDSNVDIVLTPCGHRSFCSTCINQKYTKKYKITICPICRVLIDKRININISV